MKAEIGWNVLKNVCANWLGLITHVAVAFFLTPLILHHLGDVAFGLWVLMATLSGYYGLFDFGIRNAIIRYAARHIANHDWENLGRVASTSLFAYSMLGLVTLAATGVIGWKFDSLFQVSPQWVQSAKLLLLILGGGMAIGFPLSVFGGILEGLQRFTWVSGIQVLAALLRAGLIILALNSGYGLLAVGSITVFVNLLCYLPYLLLTRRLCPELHFKRAYVQKATLTVLASFGLVTFWIGIAQTLRFDLDLPVIGSFLSLEAVTLFAISSKLVAYATGVVQTMAQVFTPMASQIAATGNVEQLRRVLVVGNRYSSLVVFPLAAILIILGKSIIRVWVGPEYLPTYTVLVILTIPTTFYLAQAASTKVLYGMAHHTLLARILLLEGLMNLLLSLVLLRWYGIVGVALGTAIPLACTSLFFLPPHLCRLLGLRLRDYLHEAHLYPLLLSVPLVVILWVADQWVQAQTYASLLLELSLGGIVYGAGVLVYFYLKERPEPLWAARWTSPVERPSNPWG